MAVEDADLVDAGDVVGMRVRVEHGVDAGDAAGEKLGAQVRAGVHQQPGPLPAFHHDAGAGAARCVARPGSQAPQSPAPSAPPISGTPAEPPVPSKVIAHAGSQAALRNRRRKFAVVRSARASGVMPRTSASTRAVWAT